MFGRRFTVPGIVLWGLALAWSSSGQTAIPVDESVQDIDPLARSLRQVPLGLRTTGEHTCVFAVPVDPGTSASNQPTGLYQPYGQDRYAYYRIGPGFRARMDRVDYLVRVGDRGLGMNIQPRRDGEFIEVIGPNAFFDLRPQWPHAPTLGAPQPLILQDQLPRMTGPTAHSAEASAPAAPGARLIEVPLSAPLDARIDGRVDGRVPWRALARPDDGR